jgi:hypothetical protein
MPALGRGAAPSGLPCGLQRNAGSWAHGDELLLEPQAPTRELTDQRRRAVEVQVVRPLARQRSFLDVLATKFWNRPLEVGVDPPEVSKDANTRGIEIPEMTGSIIWAPSASRALASRESRRGNPVLP